MVDLFLANGFEEAEAIVPADILRRAGVDVRLVGVLSENAKGRAVAGSHGIAVNTDITAEEAPFEGLEMIVLPGGYPGYENLWKSEAVKKFIGFAAEKDLFIGAICAAPVLLGRMGLLRGRKAVCFPGHEAELEGAVLSRGPVCEDGKIVTAKGAGAAMQFGFALAAKLKGKALADETAAKMQWSL